MTRTPEEVAGYLGMTGSWERREKPRVQAGSSSIPPLPGSRQEKERLATKKIKFSSFLAFDKGGDSRTAVAGCGATAATESSLSQTNSTLVRHALRLSHSAVHDNHSSHGGGGGF
jgi:hypothetical protein